MQSAMGMRNAYRVRNLTIEDFSTLQTNENKTPENDEMSRICKMLMIFKTLG
jgi:hypothetical protein